MLTTLPALCMGIFAPLGQRLAHAIGREPTIAWALGLITVGTVLRLGGGTAPLLYGATLVLGVGIAIVGTVLPGVIKEHFATRSGAVTTLFSAGMALGAAIAAQLTVPLARALATWQAALATWGLLSLVGLTLWLVVTAISRERHERDWWADRPGLPWRSSTAWLLMISLLCNGWQFFAVISWIPATFERLGSDPASAASLLTVFSIAQASPAWSCRCSSTDSVTTDWLIGSARAPGHVGRPRPDRVAHGSPMVWVATLVFGLGSGFAMMLVLLVVYAATPSASARLTAMVFLWPTRSPRPGRPMVFGWIADLTGSMKISWGLLVVVSVLELGVVARLSSTPASRLSEADQPAVVVGLPQAQDLCP